MSGGPLYFEMEPPASLRPFVRCLWGYEDRTPSGEDQRIAPDGCPELVIDYLAPYAELVPGGGRVAQPAVILAGQITRPMVMCPTGPTGVVAARFQPDGARDFLQAPLSSITDQRHDMQHRLSGFVMPEAATLEQRVQALAVWLDALCEAEVWSLDPLVREEVERIEAGDEALRRSPGETRALQRRFADRVGLSPRALRSIRRFRHVFDLADLDSGQGWLTAGLEAGYFDQPQMARDFRRYLGCSATRWAREQVELARTLASQSYKPSAEPDR